MDPDKIKVLHYIKHLESGGGETLIYNIYKRIDRSKIQFDFLVNQEKEEILNSKVRKLGGKVIPLIKSEPHSAFLKIIKCSCALYKLLLNGGYSIIHIHCSNGQGLLFSYIARKAKVPVRIVHIHNADVDGNFKFLKRCFHKLCRVLFMDAPTGYIACSGKAASWLFSKDIYENKKYLLLKNGIDIQRFMFDQQERKNVRKELGWNRYTVIVNVGRMESEKNQSFLLDIFHEVVKQRKDFRLLIIGKGNKKKEILNKIGCYGLTDKVKLINYTGAVERYLWASDIFVLPSISEGLAIAAIEAQASGITTIVSDSVPQEAVICEETEVIALKESAKDWAKVIIQRTKTNKGDRMIEPEKLAEYDINKTVGIMENYYEKQSDQRML